MRNNSLRRLWLLIFLFGMACKGFAESGNATFVINVCAYGNTFGTNDGDYVDTFPNKKPKHTPSYNGQRISVAFLFHEYFGDICISIFKDGCNVVDESGIVVSPEGSLKYDFTPYGHGSYYICITNGSTVLYDENVEL